MKDVEIILRGFAMLVNHNDYRPSMVKFLNAFSAQAKRYNEEDILYFENLFKSFVANIVNINPKLFFNNDRFNIATYESIFVALTEGAYESKTIDIKNTTLENVNILRSDNCFISASLQNTASTANVTLRIEKAKELL